MIVRSVDDVMLPVVVTVPLTGVRAATVGGHRTVVEESGAGFLRDMDAQSARAHSFERRMRWFWFRRRLRLAPPPDVELIDLRPATTSAAPVVPRPRG
jgi:hypothetical protein